ncbi:MAG: hypothetical protein HUU02_09120, partial [Bacteroidetes bacterium]|nr:hypothetical protein [Bacteroidota bacterium]
SWGLLSLSAGLSLVGGVQRGAWVSSSGWFSSQFEEKTFSHAGIPLEAQWIWRPLDDFGVGLYAFGNINRTKPFYGALLSLQIGRFTERPGTPATSSQ